MRTSALGRSALSASIAGALLVGCGGTQPPIAPGAIPQAMRIAPARFIVHDTAPSSYSVLHNFGSSPDGSNPVAGLIDVSGKLYGTTQNGGPNSYGVGTVFSITTSGSETVLHGFGYDDGATPDAGLVDVSGKLYGTTSSSLPGGSKGCGCGTVYSISTNGNEKVLHFFGLPPDGITPLAPLLELSGILYGTTLIGGAKDCPEESGCGTIFSVAKGGKEKVLRSFTKAKGYAPAAGLINVGGTLYGTASKGGAYDGGTVFSFTPGGTVKVLHSFGQGSDGSSPQAALVDVNGTLYGTTEAGGADQCHSYSGLPSCGTVFSITTGGTERVVHNFSQSDGCNPVANLIDVKGTLYGTTSSCGLYYFRGGTVFSLTTAGKETVLHAFGKEHDGFLPLAGLVNKDGTLYGTTFYGGAYESSDDYGNGTVFALKP
jgi:uncharacterized repeat protein (TIGR03803 family)